MWAPWRRLQMFMSPSGRVAAAMGELGCILPTSSASHTSAGQSHCSDLLAAPPSTQRHHPPPSCTHHIVLHQAVQRELGLIVHVNLHGLQNKQWWNGGSGAAAIRRRAGFGRCGDGWRGKQCLHQVRTPSVEEAGVASWWSSASNHTRPLLASSCRR